jgi:class I fructose-bisphosphate aldolase
MLHASGSVPLIQQADHRASGENDFAEAAKTAVINKRAGGMGLISGRKAFQRPMAEGVKLLNTIQDVYLDPKVTIA